MEKITGDWGKTLMVIDISKYFKLKEEEKEIEKFNEIEFQSAYKEFATKQGLSLDPYDPRHFYDYEALWRETHEFKVDKFGHLPSEYKEKGHPREVVDGINTITGEAVSGGGGSAGVIPEGEGEKKFELNKYIIPKGGEKEEEKPDPFDTLNESIEKNYKQYQSLTKQLEKYQAEYDYAPDNIKPSIAANFNKLVKEQGDLVKQLESDITKRDTIISTKYKVAFSKYKQLTGLPETTFPKPPVAIEEKSKGILEWGKDPKMMELHKINFESFKLWFKELKESKDKVAFFKGEGQSPELKELRKQYKEKAPYMYEKSEQWIENVSMISVGIGMAYQLVNAAVTSGFKVKDKVISAKELKGVLERARAAFVPETGKFKATLSDNDFAIMKQLNVFFKTSGRGTAAREMLEKIVEKTGGLSFPQQVNIFGGRLYAGVPIDEMVKSIVAVGRLTQDIANQLKVMNPIDTGLVFQQLSMVAPVIASKVASQFVDLIPQKITKIPKAGEEMTPEELEQFEKLKEAKIIPEEAEIKAFAFKVEPKEPTIPTEIEDDYKLIDKWIKANTPKTSVSGHGELKEVSKLIREGKAPKEVLEAMHRQFEKTKDQETGEMLWWNDEAYPRTGTLMDFYNAYENLDLITRVPTPAKEELRTEPKEPSEGDIQFWKDMESLAVNATSREDLIRKIYGYYLDKEESTLRYETEDLGEGRAEIEEIADLAKDQAYAEINKKYGSLDNFIKQTQVKPIERELEKIEPEPTPEEIKSAFMKEEHLGTTVKNREYFLGKFGNLFTETKAVEDTLIKQKFNEMNMLVEYEEDEIYKLAFGKEKMRIPETTKTEWMEGLGKGKYMQIFRVDKNLQYPDEIASNLGISENELREQIIERIRTAPRGVTLESAKQALIDEGSSVFMQVTAQMDAYRILLDEIEGGEYSFDTPKNVKRLNAKISALKSDSKKLMDEYEKKITEIQKKGIDERFEELKKKSEAREKIGIEIGIKKGLKVAKAELKGKKFKDMTKEEIKEGSKLIKQIQVMVKDRGFTKKQFSDIKMTHGGARSLSGKTKRMTIPQLKAVLKAIEAARPHRIGHKKVLSLKTENKIQSLKNTLIEEMQMNEETYQEILKSERVYKEPKYIDAKHFITEEQGKRLIYRLLNESNLLRITEPYRRAREAHPESEKIVDRLLKKMEAEGERGLKDPHDLQSMRYIVGKMGIITGADFYPVYRALIDINLENRADLHNFLEDLNKFKEVIKDKKRLKVSESWILAKSELEGKPEVPKDITEKEIELAKKVEGILKDYQSVARTEKFLDNIENLEKMPQYKQYRKEINKAKDIFESKGLDALKDYLKDQKWGIKTSGYDPMQVISPKIRAYKSSPLTFGKGHIKVRTDIEYQEQDKDMIQRLVSYKKSMDNLSKLRGTLYAFFQLTDNNLSKFKDPDHIKDIVETFARELRGYNTPKNWFDRIFVRAYAQAMKTIVMISPTLSIGRNLVLGQNLAIGHDKFLLIDPRNKALSKERIEFIKTYVLQAEFMKFEWFESREKPLPGLGWITKIAEKVGLYPWSDTANRYWCFWGKINQVDRAFANITPDSTEAEIEKAMWKAKFSDFREYEQVMALDILAKDGKEEMLRYLARTYTDDEHFIYQRAQRAPAEMGRVGRIWGNLMLWARAYWEKLFYHGSKVIGKNIPFKERWRGLEVLSNIIIGGMLVGAAYKKVTGRRENPYNPLNLLAYEPGGLALGAIEAVSDVYVNMILATKGDKRALAVLTTAFPHAADMFIPFYDYALRAIEASTDTKNIDVLALRKIRMLLDKEYQVRGGAYVVNRNALERWQYFLSGAGIDVAIKEREKKEKEKGMFPSKIKFPEKSKFTKIKFPKRP